MVNRLHVLLFVIILILSAPRLASAREDDGKAPVLEPVPPTGDATGAVVNDTPDGTISGAGEPMLHIWDEAFNEKGMEHGELREDGTFLFEEVPVVPAWQYAVMLNYQGVTYFSRPATVAAGQSELALELPIYESTAATDAVSITGQHVLFDAAGEGQLMVGEIYILSNGGERTVVASEENLTAAPLRFALPAGGPQATPATTPFWQNNALAPAIIALGVLLLGLAVWLYIRPQRPAETAQPAGATFDAVVQEIALLDQAHDRGRLADANYERRRGYLFQEARRLLPEKKSGELEMEIETEAG